MRKREQCQFCKLLAVTKLKLEIDFDQSILRNFLSHEEMSLFKCPIQD